MEAVVVFLGRGGGAEGERDLHGGGGLVGEVANRGLVAELVGVGFVALVGGEGVAAGDFEAAVEDGAVNDLVGGRRDALEARAAVEAGEVDEGEHRVGVEGVEDEGGGAVEVGGVDEAVLRIVFFEGDIADGAAGIGEANFDEAVGEGGDRGAGGVGAGRGEGGIGDGGCDGGGSGGG